MTSNRHPDQPIIVDCVGIVRFKSNEIVRLLLDHGPYDLNTLYEMEFSDDDRNQFAQLIGYSVSGFGELSYADNERVKTANTIAFELSNRNKHYFEVVTVRGDRYDVLASNEDEAIRVAAQEKRVDESFFISCVLVS